jgi:glycosyltransferase involved in cell wall biosynthesis
MRKQDKKLTSSVIICTKDREKDLLECIDSLKTQTVFPEEIVIVDAGKENGIKGKLEEKVKTTPIKLKYIRTEPGLTRQRNLGVKNSKGDIVFFFDDDVVLDKDYLKNVLEIYANTDYKNIGGVGAISSNSKIGKLGFYFSKIFTMGPFKDRRGEYIKDKKEIAFTNCLPGYNMSYKKEIFKKFSFDENLKGYSHGEDFDFCYHVSKECRLLLSSTPKLLHKLSQIGRVKPERNRNEVLFYFDFFKRKLPKTPQNLLFYFWLNSGLFLRPVLKLDFSMLKGVSSGYLQILGSLLKVKRKNYGRDN